MILFLIGSYIKPMRITTLTFEGPLYSENRTFFLLFYQWRLVSALHKLQRIYRLFSTKKKKKTGRKMPIKSSCLEDLEERRGRGGDYLNCFFLIVVSVANRDVIMIGLSSRAITTENNFILRFLEVQCKSEHVNFSIDN